MEVSMVFGVLAFTIREFADLFNLAPWILVDSLSLVEKTLMGAILWGRCWQENDDVGTLRIFTDGNKT
jgi:hypothetical protein